MAKTITVPLTEPILGHGGNHKEIVLREPRGIDYIELGEPISYARAEKGMIVHAENDTVIKAYLERCIANDHALLFLSQISLADMMSVKEALLGFFADARSARLESASNSSSAISDGSAPTGPAR